MTDIDSSVALSSIEVPPRHDHTRLKIRHVMESNVFQTMIMSLVVFDMALVTLELSLNLHRHKDEDDHIDTIKFLHFGSVCFLSIFMIEVMAKIWTYRKEFFTDYLELFDAVIIITAFAFDLAHYFVEGAMHNAGDFVIVARFWRVARIINGTLNFFTTNSNLIKLKEENELLKAEIGELKEQIVQLKATTKTD